MASTAAHRRPARSAFNPMRLEQGTTQAVIDARHLRSPDGFCAKGPDQLETMAERSTAATIPTTPLREVWAAFSGTPQALRALVDEADLAGPLQHPAGAYSNVGGMLLYVCYHRGYHAGRRMLRHD